MLGKSLNKIYKKKFNHLNNLILFFNFNKKRTNKFYFLEGPKLKQFFEIFLIKNEINFLVLKIIIKIQKLKIYVN